MPTKSAPRLRSHVGCSGWYYWHWNGSFYPATIKRHHWFRHYTTVFRTVELNAPFYRWPRPETVKGWKRNAPRGFKYAIKVNGSITHEKRMRGTKRLVREFYGIAEVLGPKLGCFLFQFPPSFCYSAARLRAIVDQLDGALPNAVEFRHKSWWRKSVYAAFRKANLIFCSVSGPRLPEELVRTTDAIYVRFHGRLRWYRHDYSREELRRWAKSIRASGAREAWIFFNNDRDCFAIKNAQMLKRLLRR